MNNFIKIFFFSTLFFLSSCTTSKSPIVEAPPSSNQCASPRPQICTREYMPVCASNKDGETKTYATGCTACSDPEVVYYQDGECGS